MEEVFVSPRVRHWSAWNCVAASLVWALSHHGLSRALCAFLARCGVHSRRVDQHVHHANAYDAEGRLRWCTSTAASSAVWLTRAACARHHQSCFDGCWVTEQLSTISISRDLATGTLAKISPGKNHRARGHFAGTSAAGTQLRCNEPSCLTAVGYGSSDGVRQLGSYSALLNIAA
jgi:hypothetical protein